MTFSERLKFYRTQKGFTQQQVADILKIQKATYSGYETGRREPDVFKIKELARIFDVTGDDLLGTGFKNFKPCYTLHPLIEKYERLNQEGKEKVDTYVEDLLDNPKYRAVEDDGEETVLVYRAACSKDHHEPEIQIRKKKDMQKFETMPTVDSDEEL